MQNNQTDIQLTDYKKAIIEGCGIGLRIEHFDEIDEQKPDIPWFEILSDNYLIEGTTQRDYLYNSAKIILSPFMVLECLLALPMT